MLLYKQPKVNLQKANKSNDKKGQERNKSNTYYYFLIGKLREYIKCACKMAQKIIHKVCN